MSTFETEMVSHGRSGTLHPAMRRLARFLLLALIAAFVLVPAVAGAVEDSGEGGETERPEVEEVDFDGEPAVIVDLDPEEEEAAPAWTYRFLIPTLMALTMVLVAFIVIRYFTEVVKGRQRPVE